MATWQICMIIVVVVLVIGYLYTAIYQPILSKTKQFTPIEKIENASSHQRQLGQPVGKPYDFFVSYRSSNAPLVRPIVEQLLGAGYKVWFDEYVISLDVKTLRDQPDLDQRLNEIIPLGIAHSKRALCFLSDSYLQSEWCRLELDLILKQLGPSNLLNIELSPFPSSDEAFSQLALAQTIPYESLTHSLDFIDPSIQWATRLLPQASVAQPIIFPYQDWVFELDSSGWRSDTRYRTVGFDNLEGPKLNRGFEGSLWTGRVMVGEMGYSARSSHLHKDKEFFLRSARFAQEFLAESTGHRCVGVHLVMLNGESHFGLTGTAYQRGQWMRLYSVALHDGLPRIKGDTEVYFNFQFTGSFEKFCRSVHYADALVQSLKWARR
ncbi:MAG: toll/interleukin-1 receptor domain-containing protein [Anaerolineae bacterium]|nr:toll/interleukin-1 receptor domain-containing protein [Anaerolineae bacterium]